MIRYSVRSRYLVQVTNEMRMRLENVASCEMSRCNMPKGTLLLRSLDEGLSILLIAFVRVVELRYCIVRAVAIRLYAQPVGKRLQSNKMTLRLLRSTW